MNTPVRLRPNSLWLYLLLLAGTFPTAASVLIPASHPHIAYIGRVSFTHPEVPCFTYPGVQIRAIFEGTSLGVAMKPNSGYFMVEIDRLPAFKIAFGENDSVRTIRTGLPDGRHEVRLTLVYEGYLRRPAFRGFILDEGKTLPAVPPLPVRKIEFIGNSITAGYGLETDDPKAPFRDETENHFYSYAALTARAFDALSQVVARSGIGIYPITPARRAAVRIVCLPGIPRPCSTIVRKPGISAVIPPMWSVSTWAPTIRVRGLTIRHSWKPPTAVSTNGCAGIILRLKSSG